MRLALFLIALVLLLACIAVHVTRAQSPPEHRDWPVYGGAPDQQHYSSLTQIDRSNVRELTVAWTYDSGEKGGLQTSPIIVDGVLYAYTPSQKVIALDAATGKLIWKFDSHLDASQPARGLAYWTDGRERRILASVMNFVYALDARTGQPISSFGKDGRIDLREHLRGDPAQQSIAVTTPGIVYRDLLIVGGREPETLPAPPGDIRAYDVRTGKLRWTFHTIPHPGEFGYDTWPRDAWRYSGAANNWAGMALDAQRGIVYVPTGSAADDMYGANRVGNDLFANCLLALDASTGKRIWHFQAVHHDLWDRDFPAPPTLVTLNRDGRAIDAVAQTSKHGFVWLFDRANGQPLFPIEEHSYPASDVPGEVTSRTQPLPTAPAPFARQRLTEDMLTNRTPAARAWALQEFRKFRSAGQFVPLSVGKDTVVFPGYDGGAEWGGSAFDPATGLLYVNANDLAWTGALAENTDQHTAAGLYKDQCAGCHGDDRSGSPPEFPSLRNISTRMSSRQIASVVRKGKGRMPGFPNIKSGELKTLVRYLTSGVDQNLSGKKEDARSFIPYRFTGYKRFLDPDGYPAVAPPWGTLSAINLNTGEYAWRVPLGDYPDLPNGKGIGTENYGGPIVTAGGVVFIAATVFDKRIRAFDKSSGQLLWEAALPFSGNATPATYMVNGRQFVVIAAAAGKDPKQGSRGVYVAFALPR
jgi:quinoprotein glucose dehydrogenase